MEDKRIQELTEEVLGRLAGQPETADLEQRVAALEHPAGRNKAVAGSGGRGKHVALRIIEVATDCDDKCILEPDQPCSNSGRCRSFGY